jgi:hypothetical protein
MTSCAKGFEPHGLNGCKPKPMTTAQLRAMIGAGAKREDLPTKANGRSVSSTRESANKAYRDQLAKIARTKAFKEKQKTLAFPKKTNNARELMKEREILINAGVRGSSFDARTDNKITVSTNIPIGKSVNYQGQAEFNPEVKSKTSRPKSNQFSPPKQNTLYNSDVELNGSVTHIENENDFNKVGEKVAIGAGVAMVSGIVIYLITKGKML